MVGSILLLLGSLVPAPQPPKIDILQVNDRLAVVSVEGSQAIQVSGHIGRFRVLAMAFPLAPGEWIVAWPPGGPLCFRHGFWLTVDWFGQQEQLWMNTGPPQIWRFLP